MGIAAALKMIAAISIHHDESTKKKKDNRIKKSPRESIRWSHCTLCRRSSLSKHPSWDMEVWWASMEDV